MIGRSDNNDRYDRVSVEILRKDFSFFVASQASMVQLRMPAQTAWVLKPQITTPGGYSQYKRVQ